MIIRGYTDLRSLREATKYPGPGVIIGVVVARGAPCRRSDPAVPCRVLLRTPMNTNAANTHTISIAAAAAARAQISTPLLACVQRLRWASAMLSRSRLRSRSIDRLSDDLLRGAGPASSTIGSQGSRGCFVGEPSQNRKHNNAEKQSTSCGIPAGEFPTESHNVMSLSNYSRWLPVCVLVC